MWCESGGSCVGCLCGVRVRGLVWCEGEEHLCGVRVLGACVGLGALSSVSDVMSFRLPSWWTSWLNTKLHGEFMHHFTWHWWCSTSFWMHETTLHVTIQICILMVTFTDLPSLPPLQEVSLVKDHLRALWESSQQHCVGGGDKEVR